MRVRLPLRSPLTSAHGTETERDVVLAAWREGDRAVGADGDVEGWGECPTLSTFGYADEITDTAWRFLCDHVGPVVATTGRLPVVEGAPMAMGAVRDAQLDARLRRSGRSLVDHLGGTPGPVPTCRVLGVDEPFGPVPGPTKFKVTPATIERLRWLRSESPDLDLAADANGSFGGPDELPGWLDEVGLRYLEQPFPPRLLDAHAELRHRVATPVALDESVGSAADLHRALAAGALDVLSVKPARLGGVEAAAAAIETCTAAGVGWFVGGMLETGVGRATALALAGVPGAAAPTDLGPSGRYFRVDLTEPVVGTDLEVLVPDGPGCGRTPDTERLADATVAEEQFG